MHNLVKNLTKTAILAAAFVVVSGTVAVADDTNSSSSGDGVLSGNSVSVSVDAPVTICGLLSALFGTSINSCTTLQPISIGTAGNSTNAGASGSGVASGNAVAIDVDLPITVECIPGCGTPPPPPPDECCVPPTTCCVPPTTCFCETTTTTCFCDTTTTSSSSTSSTSSTSTTGPPTTPPSTTPGERLPDTGTSTDLQLPIGGGLVAAGALFVWASRRRMARLATG